MVSALRRLRCISQFLPTSTPAGQCKRVSGRIFVSIHVAVGSVKMYPTYDDSGIEKNTTESLTHSKTNRQHTCAKYIHCEGTFCQPSGQMRFDLPCSSQGGCVACLGSLRILLEGSLTTAEIKGSSRWQWLAGPVLESG